MDPACPVQLVFVPSYLNGDDGIFDKHYYELLCGMDVTVFASYYEPWGYTPLESIAFSVPTITTSLTGFGLWVDEQTRKNTKGVDVIARNDTNDSEVVAAISAALARYQRDERGGNTTPYRVSALEISKIALWKNLIEFYYRGVPVRRYDRANDADTTAPHTTGAALAYRADQLRQTTVG